MKCRYRTSEFSCQTAQGGEGWKMASDSRTCSPVTFAFSPFRAFAIRQQQITGDRENAKWRKRDNIRTK